MRSDDFPFLADWFAISLRWITLLGIALALAVSTNLTIPIGIVIFVSSMWNIFISILAMLNSRLKIHRWINVLVDLLISLLLYIFGGGFFGSLLWAGVLVILTSAIYYEWRGSLLMALIISLLEVGFTYLTQLNVPFASFSQPIILITVAQLIIAAVMGILSHQLICRVRDTYHDRVNKLQQVKISAQEIERRKIKTFYSMMETLSSTLNYQRVLESALDLSHSTLDEKDNQAHSLVSAVLMFAERDMVVSASRGLTTSDLRSTFPAEEGILKQAINSGGVIPFESPASDPEISRLTAFQSCASGVCLPLIRGLDAYGAILFAHPNDQFFTAEKIELLEMISRQAVIAIQNARLYHELEHEKEQIVETQEEERKKLARALHDGPTQSVSSIAMRLSVAEKMLYHSPLEETEAELLQIEDLARRTTDEIRHMLFTLRPLVLESEGLPAALQSIAERMKSTYQQQVSIKVDQELCDQLNQSQRNTIFFLVEEAVNNARKHATASLIIVYLRRSKNEPQLGILEVMDNGVGFDFASVKKSYDQRGSLGMLNLEERARLINGLLDVDSIPGKGTRIRILIPLDENMRDRLHQGLIPLSQS